MPYDAQLMTISERYEFLETNKRWLGDLVVAEYGFFDYSEGLGVSDTDTKEILETRKRENRPWKPA